MTGATAADISAIQRLSNDLRFGDAAPPGPMFEQPVVAPFDVDLFANHTSQYASPAKQASRSTSRGAASTD